MVELNLSNNKPQELRAKLSQKVNEIANEIKSSFAKELESFNKLSIKDSFRKTDDPKALKQAIDDCEDSLEKLRRLYADLGDLPEKDI